MSLSIIVAMAENRVIGRDGGLPWHISADLKRFRRLTTGHAIVMGRKTYDSIGRPLPERRSIVISGNRDYAPAGVEVVPSLEAAWELAGEDDEVFVIGGASIYAAALPLAETLHVTRIHAEVAGDVWFPEVDWRSWQLVEQSAEETDEKSGLTYSFAEFRRAREDVG
ncbi:MAG: dihydrofolate reductase [Planctomycetota bacterium]|nr:MAG: dihydrofolate reductase [Planctomycetota bacterium]REK40771.1 MAG: dihydrofolate reductase [Planctomycetota bacterium]